MNSKVVKQLKCFVYFLFTVTTCTKLCPFVCRPQNLELTSSNEIILMESIEVFRKNGFDFVVNEESKCNEVYRGVQKEWI